MADNRQFGSPKIPQFGDRISPGGSSGESQVCSQCEAMLTDALDGTLSTDEQTVFDGHVAYCGACSQMLADARRGAAWLEMLRDPRPEPPAELLERILLQTSGTEALQPGKAAAVHEFAGVEKVPAIPFSGGSRATPSATGAEVLGKVLPFRSRLNSVVRSSAFGQAVLQPRLAMTAAMAFFSVALTLNLTGVRLQDLRASDLRPGSIKRDFYSANARVVQYYEGLRVVYELESRVHDLQSGSDSGTGSNGQTAPAQTPAPKAAPADRQPESQPIRKRPAPTPGTSRRDGFPQGGRLLASTTIFLESARSEEAQA